MDLNKMRRRDLEQLSAYIDGELREKDARQVEARLASDSAYRLALEELKNTRELVSQLPTVQPPRNFTLTPEMAGIKRGLNLFPVFRFATVIATAAFAVLVGADALLLRGGGLPSLRPEPIGMLAAEEARAVVPVDEELEGMMEAPLEDAVIGAEVAEGPEAPAAEEDVEEPSAMVLPTEDLDAPSENRFQGFGTDTGEGFAAEATEVDTTATPMARATQTQMDGEQPAVEEPTPAPPIEAEPDQIQDVEPTQTPVLPEEPRPKVDPFRIAEIGLGALAVLSAAITLLLRRAR